MKKMLVFIAVLIMVTSMFSVNALVIKKVSWGFNTATGRLIGFPTITPPFSSIPIKPVCQDTDASPDYGLIGIPSPEVQQNNADLFVRAQATGVLQSGILPQVTGEDPNKCSQRFLDPSAGYATFMDCCTDTKTLTEAFCKGSTGPFSVKIPCKYGCKDGVCLKAPQVCSDTDGGKNYDVKGVTTAYDGYQQTDVCHSPGPIKECSGPNCYLSEFYCGEGQMVHEENYVCPNGCRDGVCVKAPVQQCTDTDGRDYYVRGTNKVVDASGGVTSTIEICTYAGKGPTTGEEGDSVIETYCEGAQKITEEYKCQYGCQNGACVSAPTPACTGIKMVWATGRSEPYQYAADACAGYRCLAGLSISPACYSAQDCPVACTNGTCVSIPAMKQRCPAVTCKDSDVTAEYPNGKNIFQKGTISGFWAGDMAGPFVTLTDYCTTTPQGVVLTESVQEYLCIPSDPQNPASALGIGQEGYLCPAGTLCKDGACVKVVVPKPPELSCQVLQENVSTAQYFTLCSKEGYDNVCFNKYTGVYQGCTKNNNNDCTQNNMNADQNVLCPVGIPVVPQPPVEQVSERVTCMFRGSRAAQKCYSSKGECSGRMFCVVAVTGARGEKVTWKSTCSGEATTVIDGRRESAVFVCRR